MSEIQLSHSPTDSPAESLAPILPTPLMRRADLRETRRGRDQEPLVSRAATVLADAIAATWDIGTRIKEYPRRNIADPSTPCDYGNQDYVEATRRKHQN